ncbi:SusC/RagA family TonB-linked outer membrane protein [Winogradskyella vidalii]|uniref:SusC/RagA family TonB-linked outer membrane protein n=1 Tax=Winogradskyella vidalii TaxID=2615024 RepID=UPI00293BEA27|nr:SusC/RagA family TonB-linked outer membrane protein [Winogradskyella vidalii]
MTIASDKTMSIYEVLELIGQQTECTFIYQSDIFNDVPNIPLKSGVIKVMTLLSQCLPESDYTITTTNDTYITISKKALQPTKQRQIEVKGEITDSAGLPISGAFISIQGRNKGTTSLIDGTYSINASADDILVFSYLGFLSQTIPVDGQHVINVQLQEDVTAFDAVVLNAGYYAVKDRERTGSIAKVNAKVIEKQPVNTALDALQGRVAGLDIVSTTGLAGGGYTVRIRGQNSIAAGNDPLYVVDGVPFDTGSLGNQTLNGLVLPRNNINPLNTLDPNSISSIEVLKDADATAIYGSRGANGVVLITTKQGNTGKTTVSIDASNTMVTATRLLDLLNTQEYLSMRREAYAQDGLTEYPMNAYDVNGTWDENRYTDWQQEFLGNTAINSSVNASISGGSERTRFNIGGSFMNETTVFANDFNYKRGTVYTTLSHGTKEDKFRFRFSANYGTDSNFLPTTDLSAKAKLLSPNAPALYDSMGNLNWENSTWENPNADLERTYENESQNFMANTVLTYTLVKGLDVMANLGYNSSDFVEEQLNPHTRFNPAYGLTSAASSALKNIGERESWIFEPQLNALYTIGGGQLSMTLGATLQHREQSSFAIYGFGYPNNSLISHFSAANTLRILNESSSQYRYQALYTRLNYNWKGKYILNLTGRRDGSSRFGTGNKFANFDALGLAWIFSEEPFLKDLKWLSFGKLRGSYGTTGNDQIGDYQYLDTFTISNGNYDGNIGLVPSRLYNPFYAWEKSRKFELAVESSFFQNHLRLELAYYNNLSSNQLLGIPLPGTTGFNSINSNLDATVENTGFELSLETINYQQEDFNWKTSAVLTIPKNELTSFEGLEESTYVNQLVIGEPLTITKGYHLLGVNSETGIFEFEDYNNDGIITPEDQQHISDFTPKFYGSIGNNLRYKQWNLDILFQFVRKDGFNELFGTNYPGASRNQPKSVLNQWQETGDTADMQVYTSGANAAAVIAYSRFRQSSGVVTDVSFARLKSLSLSYKLPLKELPLIDCTLYVQGQNLLTFSKLRSGDPEQISGFTPPLRRFSFGVRIKL